MTNPASSRRHTETPLTPDVPPNGDATTGHLDGRSLPENGSHSNADEERHHYVPDTTQADTESEAPSDDGTADLDWGDDLTDQGDIDMDAVVVEAEILDDDSIQDPEADLADADMVEARLVEDPKAEPPTTPTSRPTVSAPLAADSAAADYSAADEYSIAPDPDEPEPGLTLRDQPAEQRSRRRFGRGRRTQRGSSPSTNSLDAEQTGATSTPFPPRLGSQEKTSGVSMFDLDREPTSPAHPLPPDQITSSPSEPPLLMDPLPTEPLQVEPLQPPEPPTR
ncbi:MAG: hypothetical protein GY939_24915, partial [Actinomycetia bacterium]|nr:hypothetical protein [Actinomycetes bacterium]